MTNGRYQVNANGNSGRQAILLLSEWCSRSGGSFLPL
jgi:hypothetical protein